MTARRRPPRRSWRDWYVPALTAGAAAFCLGPSLVGSRTLISVNSLTNFLPWAAAGNEAAGHELCQSDTIDSVLPSAAYIRHQIFSGHLPNWQSLQSGGGPLGSLPNAGMLDPLSLPYWILPLRWAPAFVILLTWVAAIGGTYLFLRRLSVGRPAATLAGFVFATSGFMVMWSNWPQARTAALIPALFWATDRVATRRRASDVVLLGAAVASMLFGGFPEITGFALYAAGGYFVVRVLHRYRRDWWSAAGTAAMAAGGLILGVALSAVQMLPFLDFYTTNNLAYRDGLSSRGLPLSGLMTLVAPAANGLCIVGRAVHGPTDPVELVAYVGAAAVVLAVIGAAFGLRARRAAQAGVRGFLLGAVVLAGLVCWVSPGARSALSSLPVFSGNFIGRIRCIVDFALAALVGFGFDWLTAARRPGPGGTAGQPGTGGAAGQPGTGSGPDWTRLLWPAFVCSEAAIFALGVGRSGYQAALTGHYLAAWDRAVRTPLALVVATAVVAAGTVALARLGDPVSARRARTMAFLVMPVLVVAQGAQFFHAVMPGDDPSAFYPRTGDHTFLASHLGHDRFASAGLTLYPATAFYYGLRSATGHQFNDPRWNTLLTTVDPHAMMGPTNSGFGGDINSGDISRQPILDQMGVRYFVLPPTDVAGVPSPAAPATGTISSAAGPISCSLPGGPLRGVALRLAAPLRPRSRLGGVTVGLSLSGPGFRLGSGAYLTGTLRPGSTVTVPLAGEDLPTTGPFRARLSVAGASGPLVVAAAGAAADCSAVRPRADGLKLVYAGAGAVVYRRLDALPRIRWAATARTVADPAAQLEALAAGVPGSSVLLSRPAPPGSGRPAAVTVGRDSGDRISATVRAAGAGYLVVADPMQVPGWSVTVNGHPARLRAADYAMVAVRVPPGTHEVRFSYSAPGQATGAAVTGVGLLASAALLWSGRQRRGRPRPAHAPRRRGRF